MKGKDVLKCGLSSKKISSSKWPINVVIKGNQSVNRSNSPAINQSARETASELMIDSESQWTIGSRCSPKQFWVNVIFRLLSYEFTKKENNISHRA